MYGGVQCCCTLSTEHDCQCPRGATNQAYACLLYLPYLSLPLPRAWLWAVYGELAAEVRLNTTAHFFDLVIIVEAWETHSSTGARKTQLYSSTP